MDFSMLNAELCSDSLEEPSQVLLTGTQAYGPVTEDSDYDVVMLRQDAKAVYNLLILLKVEVTDSRHVDPSYEGFYFKLNELEKVQIIVAGNQREFVAWKQATKQMRKEPQISNRRKRIEHFKGLFDLIFLNRGYEYKP